MSKDVLGCTVLVLLIVSEYQVSVTYRMNNYIVTFIT